MKSFRQLSLSCRVCGKTKSRSQMIPAVLVRNAIADQIRMELPDWSAEGYICAADLNRFRMRYIHEKIDHLLTRRWERLVEIQQIQIDLMSEIARIRGKSPNLP